jgi:hypothetical protein
MMSWRTILLEEPLFSQDSTLVALMKEFQSGIPGSRRNRSCLWRATGASDDTIDGCTGFLFRSYLSSEFLNRLRAALRICGSPRWDEM